MKKGAELTIQGNVTISKNTIITLSEGANCLISKGTKILENNYLQVGKDAKMQLGEKVFINRNCHIVAIDHMIIGNDVAFGNNISIFDHDHVIVPEGKQDWTKAKKSPISIGDNSWIASNVVILRGTQIGNNCVVGANAVVKGMIPDKTMCYSENKLITKEIK